jgi:protein-S-isoprenylcysteine O-methyltransferase Ste14
MALGYVLGATIFLIAMPSVIVAVTALLDEILHIEMIQNALVKSALAIASAAIGLIFVLWSIIIQNLIGKGGPLEMKDIAEISPKTKKLVMAGPYKYTRNPMLFGTFMLYLGLAIHLDSMNAIILVFIFIILMMTIVVSSEEKRLQKDFGEEYIEYRKKVSVFIPWLPEA